MITEHLEDCKKITCPHCESINCFQEDYEQDGSSLSAYMCLSCGYTTSTLNVDGTEFVTQYEDSCPTLFKDLKFVDPDTNLAWYPMVLNFPTIGLVFPDGASALDWSWRAVPVKPVSESEKTKFPIPNEPGKFYETKADIDSSRLYPQNQFYQACKFLGIIVE